MIFYRITREENHTVDWERTMADAIKTVKALGSPAHQFKQEDVPTDSHGLHAWLKANALGEKRVKRQADPLYPPDSTQPTHG